MKYNKLFSPFKINKLELKNRIVMLPIHLLYTPKGQATDRINEFYWKRAEGGVGLIIVGGCSFDDYGRSTNMMSLSNDDMIPGWKKFTDGIHNRGAKVAVQLYHAGRYARSSNIKDNKKPLAPSSVYSNYSKETPIAMSKEDIYEVINNWVDGSLRAIKAGFDAVEIVGSAGYLISQFLSPLTNQRNDEYGGSLENRIRFPYELISQIRQAVGPDYPIIVRLSGNDFVENSNNLEDSTIVAKYLEEAGASLFNITGGWHETKIPQLSSDVPSGGFSYLSKSIKNNVKIPVIVSNRINNADKAEDLLQRERADLIGMGRGFIADPYWPKKILDNDEDKIQYCIGCNQGCLAKTFFGEPVTCLVNPEAGIEYKRKYISPTNLKKKILVIGAGVAGLEFSIRAAKSGHEITIIEKSNEIGGQLKYVMKPDSKKEFEKVMTYYLKNINNKNIKLILNAKLTNTELLDFIKLEDFDKVVVSTGAKPKQIEEWSENDKVHSFEDIYDNNIIPGRKIIIVGGGSIGCELAMYLAQKSSLSKDELFFMMTQNSENIADINKMLNSTDREIIIIEQSSRLGNGFDPGCGWPILKELDRLGVKPYLNTKIKQVKDNNILLESKDPQDTITESIIKYDDIILAIGSNSQNDIYTSLKNKGVDVEIIGDAKKVRNLLEATKDAMNLVDVL